MVENVTAVFRSWREGTVIRSWLLDLLVAALDDEPGLEGIRGYADDSGEGRWTVEAGIEHAVPRPAITAALYARFVSRQDDSPAMKAVAAMRNQFGGHALHTEPPPAATPAAGRTRRPRRSRDPCTSPTSPCTTSGPIAAVEVELGPGRDVVRRPQRPGQDQPRRGDRLPLPADLAPGGRRRAAGAPRGRAGRRPRGGGARRTPCGAGGRDQPGPVQPRSDQPVAVAEGARPARPGAHGGVLPRGPGPGQGRPDRAPPVRRRPAGLQVPRGTPAPAPTTTGCSSSATRC